MSKKIISKKNLELLEKKYGGFIKNVPIKKNSNLDPNLNSMDGIYYTGKDNNITKLQSGGDRMSSNHMSYGLVYEKIINNLSNINNVLEIGILTGIGLAIWSDIFPNATINGLDIDLSNFDDNKSNLLSKGAFKNNNVIVNEFDQYDPNIDLIKKLTKDFKFDFIIDDGCHQDNAIITTFTKLYPFLEKNFVYIIEDNFNAYKTLLKNFPNVKATNIEQITVITDISRIDIHESLSSINKLNSTKHAVYFTNKNQIVSHSTNNHYANILLDKYEAGDTINLNKDKLNLEFEIIKKKIKMDKKVILYFSNKLNNKLLENRHNWNIS